jgi:hypothetical protein
VTIPAKKLIYNLTETATGEVFADKIFNFVDSSAENLVERVLYFDSEFVD